MLNVFEGFSIWTYNLFGRTTTFARQKVFCGEGREGRGGGAGTAAVNVRNSRQHWRWGIHRIGFLRILLFALELLVCLLAILTIVLALVTDHLAARVQDEVAALADTVDVVADGGELASLEGTLLRLQDLLEAISRELGVLQVVRLVLVWGAGGGRGECTRNK